MTGKTCIVTGANAGIGKATAAGLAERGARVVMLCRNRERGEAARGEIVRETGSEAVALMLADLASQASIRRFAAEFKKRYDRLDVLINNAAVIPRERTLTEDGIEMQFAVNHLAYFLLTHLLLDVLKRSAPARIINVSSQAHRAASLDFVDLQSAGAYRPVEKGGQAPRENATHRNKRQVLGASPPFSTQRYHPRRVYSRTKLANVLFTYELARRLRGSGVTANEVGESLRDSPPVSERPAYAGTSGVTANCLHPGVIATNVLANYLGFRPFLRFLAKLVGRSPERGARTSLYLATAPELEGVTGQYFVNGKPARSSAISYDAAAARRLWEASAELSGLPETV